MRNCNKSSGKPTRKRNNKKGHREVIFLSNALKKNKRRAFRRDFSKKGETKKGAPIKEGAVSFHLPNRDPISGGEIHRIVWNDIVDLLEFFELVQHMVDTVYTKWMLILIGHLD